MMPSLIVSKTAKKRCDECNSSIKPNETSIEFQCGHLNCDVCGAGMIVNANQCQSCESEQRVSVGVTLVPAPTYRASCHTYSNFRKARKWTLGPPSSETVVDVASNNKHELSTIEMKPLKPSVTNVSATEKPDTGSGSGTLIDVISGSPKNASGVRILEAKFPRAPASRNAASESGTVADVVSYHFNSKKKQSLPKHPRKTGSASAPVTDVVSCHVGKTIASVKKQHRAASQISAVSSNFGAGSEEMKDAVKINEKYNKKATEHFQKFLDNTIAYPNIPELFEAENYMEEVKSKEKAEYSIWRKNSALCFGCKERIPHSQLMVCRFPSCQHKMEQRVSIKHPSQFFDVEQVFCGVCTFRSIHETHSSAADSALEWAIKIASSETGKLWEGKLNASTALDKQEPFDCVLGLEKGVAELPSINVVDYLRTSNTVYEWEKRFNEIRNLCESVSNARLNFREIVSKVVSGFYGEYKSTYTAAKKAIEDDFKIRRASDESQSDMSDYEDRINFEDGVVNNLNTSCNWDNDKDSQMVDDSRHASELDSNPEEDSTRNEDGIMETMLKHLNTKYMHYAFQMDEKDALIKTSEFLGGTAFSDVFKLEAARVYTKRFKRNLIYEPKRQGQ